MTINFENVKLIKIYEVEEIINTVDRANIKTIYDKYGNVHKISENIGFEAYTS